MDKPEGERPSARSGVHRGEMYLKRTFKRYLQTVRFWLLLYATGFLSLVLLRWGSETPGALGPDCPDPQPRSSFGRNLRPKGFGSGSRQPHPSTMQKVCLAAAWIRLACSKIIKTGVMHP